MKQAFIFFADGFEQSEALIPHDILKRGGVKIRTVSITEDKVVASSHKLKIVTDLCFSEFLEDFDIETVDIETMLIFPGGLPGTKNLAEKKELIELMNEHYKKGGSLSAICAAPGLVLSQLDDFTNINFTTYKGFEDEAIKKGGIYRIAPVVKDGRIITSIDATSAFEFGYAILSHMKGQKVAEMVRNLIDIS